MKDRTGRTRRRGDRLDEARPERATALRRRVIDPALSETALTSLSDLNRLVRTRMLGGVGAGEGDLPGYPISPDLLPHFKLCNFIA